MRRKRRWFLPDTPDLVGQLHLQAEIALEGLDEFVAWANGDTGAAERLGAMKDRADTAKRDLLEQIREAFLTPIAPEDLFTLSRGIDWILDHARDLVGEAIAMDAPPDARIAEMAGLLRDAMAEIGTAVGHLQSDGEAASAAADEAVRAVRRMELVYFRGMAEQLDVDSRQERISSRELYRLCTRIGDVVIEVAERIVYAVVKES